MKPDELIEWRHPVGHHWRWEFAAITPTITCVTETFDCRDTGPLKDRLKYYERTGLTELRNRYGGWLPAIRQHSGCRIALPGADDDHRNFCRLHHRGADRAQQHASGYAATVTADHHQLSVLGIPRGASGRADHIRAAAARACRDTVPANQPGVRLGLPLLGFRTSSSPCRDSGRPRRRSTHATRQGAPPSGMLRRRPTRWPSLRRANRRCQAGPVHSGWSPMPPRRE